MWLFDDIFIKLTSIWSFNSLKNSSKWNWNKWKKRAKWLYWHSKEPSEQLDRAECRLIKRERDFNFSKWLIKCRSREDFQQVSSTAIFSIQWISSLPHTFIHFSHFTEFLFRLFNVVACGMKCMVLLFVLLPKRYINKNARLIFHFSYAHSSLILGCIHSTFGNKAITSPQYQMFSFDV